MYYDKIEVILKGVCYNGMVDLPKTLVFEDAEPTISLDNRSYVVRQNQKEKDGRMMRRVTTIIPFENIQFVRQTTKPAKEEPE